ncbi:MAG: tetratricopeptide repeat protein [Gemmatimonadetes bacterium]|nr:tetratricopeptide repeat protein [Gemmatimonadota bacterium]
MAKRHPGQRRRLTQNKAETEEDIFIAKVLGFWTWARSNQTFLTVVVLVGAVAVGSFFYYRSYRRGLVAQAGNQLEQIHQSIALNDTAGAKSQLKVFVSRFGGTPYEGEARMLLGEIYLEGGAPKQAQAVLEPIGSSPSTPLELQAAGLLARSYEQENRWKEAEDLYLRIADRSTLDFQVRGALADAARIRANHGDKAGAVELYKRILDGLDKNAPERGLYEMRLAELNTESETQAQAPAETQKSGGV